VSYKRGNFSNDTDNDTDNDTKHGVLHALYSGLNLFWAVCLCGEGFLFNSDSDECPMPSLAARIRVKPILCRDGLDDG